MRHGLRSALKQAMMAGRGGGIEFLLRDDFTTPESAPLASPRTCEPGPGTLSSLGNNTYISDGKMYVPDDDGAKSDSFAQVAGRALMVDIAAVGTRCLSGLAASNSSDLFVFDSAGNIGTGGGLNSGLYQYSLTRPTFVVLRDPGLFAVHLVDDEWKLSWVDDSISNSPVRWANRFQQGTAQFKTVRWRDLPAPWDTDDGIATDTIDGNVSEGTEYLHEADCLIEFYLDTLGANDSQFAFRMQDADNYWSLSIGPDSTLRFYEVVATVATLRGAYDPPGSPEGIRFVIICDDETIRIYSDDALRITYSSAANFKTSTSGKMLLSGAGYVYTDLKVWPRTLSGAAAAALTATVEA